MKRVAKPVFFIVALLIIALSCMAFFGVHGRNGDIPVTYIKGLNDIRWGIDIKGGVEATFSPADGVQATREDMESAKAIIELRMVNNNITDYELYADYDNGKVIVRFPWKEDETDFDPEAAVEELSATALLTFREGGEYETTEVGSDGQPIYKTPAGTTAENVIMDGKDVVSAKAGMIQDDNGAQQFVVDLEFNDEGRELFGEATSRLVGQTISIWMDDVMISQATVQEPITEGHCSISREATANSPGFTSAEVSALASKIQAGALPFKLETTNLRTINPTLGASALNAMALAGAIALVLVCLFMLIVYRVPGFVACIALLGQVALSLACVSGFFNFVPSFTLTLPGIAGVILSIGMGVDANIITNERIKEELRAGKTLDGAIRTGSKTSFATIFDGNITVIIVAVILMLVFGPSNILSGIFGASTTGTIYSFGYTLLVGVIGNFLMGVTASRLMLSSLSGYKFMRKKSWYGGGAE